MEMLSTVESFNSFPNRRFAINEASSIADRAFSRQAAVGGGLEDFLSTPQFQPFQDMPASFDSLLDVLGPGEYVLEEAGGDVSQPIVYEEIIDFFMDDGKVLISRSGMPIPRGSNGFSPIPTSAPTPTSGSTPAIITNSLAANNTDQSRSLREESIVTAANTKPLAFPAKSATFVEQKLAVKREKNRLAAERCRNRRVQLVDNLKAEIEALRAEKELLLQQNRILMEALNKTSSNIIPAIKQ